MKMLAATNRLVRRLSGIRVPGVIRAEHKCRVYPKDAKRPSNQRVNGRSLWFGPPPVLESLATRHPWHLSPVDFRRTTRPNAKGVCYANDDSSLATSSRRRCGGVQIRTAAGRIQIVSAALFQDAEFQNAGDQFLRRLVGRLFQHAAVRLAKIDRARKVVEIHDDEGTLDPHTALTFFSEVLRTAVGDTAPNSLDDFLKRVPGNICRIERRRADGTPRIAARRAVQTVLANLNRLVPNSRKANGSREIRAILVGEEFICEYTAKPEPIYLRHRGGETSGSETNGSARLPSETGAGRGLFTFIGLDG